ncbi:amino acid adenylation domain-containing protein, partial [Tenacibaculum xiamenense]|uniref:amino acid adenylation domain-containing protein n=1 Tax=Tenacibaculum xiamenense TaxID=1261553 RepID=UPI0038B50C74
MNLKEKLHLAQLEVYYGQLIDPQSPIYNMGGYAILTGKLDIALFRSAVASLSSVYDTYNFRYDFTGVEPLFYVGDHKGVHLNEIDFSEDLHPEQKAKEWMQQGIDTAFDLKEDKLYNYTLIKLAEDVHWWCCYNHHLVYDGFGSALMVSYVIEEYDRRLNKLEQSESVKYPSYFDIAKKSNDYLQSKQYEKDAEYWKEKFSSIPESIISDNSNTKNTGGQRFSIEISKSDRELFSRLTEKTKANLPQFTIAALLLYFGKTTDKNSFSFGVPIHNRVSREERKALGMFSGAIPFKGTYNPDEILIDFITDVKKTQRNDYRHRQYPISHLNRSLKLLSEGRRQLFDILVNYEPFPFPKSLESGLHVAIKHLSTIIDLEVPLSFRWCDYGEDSSLILNVDFLQEYFGQEEIEKLTERLLFTLRQFEDNLSEPLKDISILSEEENTEILEVFNNTTIAYPEDKTLIDLFNTQVEKTPNAIAVVYKDEELTYKELDELSNQLAQYLVANYSINIENSITVILERSNWLIVSMLAILKTGATYVPIDPSYPEERKSYILNDSDSIFSIDNEFLNEFKEHKDEYLTNSTGIALDAKNLAYIIYTSGSTGKPKGVLIEHRSIINTILSQIEIFSITPESHCLQFASQSFDASISEIFTVLLKGATLYTIEEDKKSDVLFFKEYIKNNAITIATLPPAFLQLLEVEDLQGFTTLVTAGEAIPLTLAKTFAESYNYINAYGPTETSICATTFKGDIGDLVPIGKPIDNTQVYILNEANELLPVGVVGELCVGGRGVARGYLNRAELTAEKFIDNPFKEGERIYKTGDLARWLPDGNIEFLGRKDDQVKIRGYRIELGEIENALASLSSVNQGCVLATADSNGNKRLVGYVVPKETFNKETIQQELKEILPEYMVPTLWISLDEMPVTSSGKIARKSLPTPKDSLLSTKEYVAPRNEIEEQLVAIWQEILGVEQIGVYDDFFELGGHSLLVVQLITRLQNIGFSIAVKDIFSKPTIAAISKNASSSSLTYQVPANGIIEGTDRVVSEMVPLLDFSQEDIDAVVSKAPGGISNIEDMYPLSPLQEGIYFHYLMSDQDHGDPYVLSSLFSFPSREKRSLFIEALQFVVDRHDVLRTCVVSEGLPQAVQIVLREAVLAVEELDVSELELLAEPGNQRMDVSKAPLLELKSADDVLTDSFYLIINQHHLVLDHVGLEKIILEITAYLSGKTSSLPTPALYRNFIGHTLHSQKLNDSESYFKNLLENIEEPTYPFNLSDVKGNGRDVEESSIFLSSKLSKQIREVGTELGMSPAVLFHAAFGLVVGRCSSKDYAIFGSLFSGRLQGVSGASDSLGLFINTLPFYAELKGTISEYIEVVKKELRTLLPYEQTPLADIQRWSGVSNEVSLFSALLNYRHSATLSEKEAIIENLGVTSIESHERTNYPFTLNVDDREDDFQLEAQISGGISSNVVLVYMQEALEQLLEGLTSEDAVEVESVTVLPKQELELLDTFNNTYVGYPLDKTLVDLFTEQVAKTPEAIAVVYENEALTFAELDERSNQLAHYLREQGVTPDTLVGICIERSIEMLVSILGILKSGGAYVPIDPEYPEDRIEYMLTDADIKLVLTSEKVTSEVLGEREGITAIALDSQWKTIESYSTGALIPVVSPENLAYVIYTSGSTGKPKGVMNQH